MPAATPPNKREERARQTREAIIEAAEKLFVEKGFAATAVSEVAKSANVTKSLIHHHFGSKEALWGAVRDRYLDIINEYIENRMHSDPSPWNVDRFRRSFEQLLKFIPEHLALYRLQAWLIAEQRGRLATTAPYVDDILASLHDSQAKKMIRSDIPPEMLLTVFWIVSENWFLTKEVYGARFGMDFSGEQRDREYFEAVSKLFLDGLAVTNMR